MVCKLGERPEINGKENGDERGSLLGCKHLFYRYRITVANKKIEQEPATDGRGHAAASGVIIMGGPLHLAPNQRLGASIDLRGQLLRAIRHRCVVGSTRRATFCVAMRDLALTSACKGVSADDEQQLIRACCPRESCKSLARERAMSVPSSPSGLVMWAADV